ncbi:MAG: hypothetical protein QGI83_21405, partial [Candidatus Latescibacteria bacterium]|nr:hypothetical protein [Candidatus Latescibacterota bacterium]
MRYMRSRSPVPWVLVVGVGLVFSSILLRPPLSFASEVVRSPDGEKTAWTVPLGTPSTLLTEIWVDGGDGSGAARIRSFLGEARDLLFLSDGRELVCLQHGLRYTPLDWAFIGTRDVPLMRSRIWRVRIDGSSEKSWPLPDDIHPEGIAVAGDSGWLIVQGTQGELSGEGERGSWLVDRAGKVTPLEPDDDAWTQERVTGGTRHDVAESRTYDGDLTEERRRALNTVQRTLDAFEKGYERMHGGRFRSASRLFDGAHETLSSIRKMDPGPDLAKADLKEHLEATGQWTDRSDPAFEQVVTRDRLCAMGSLIDRYRKTHDGRDPDHLGEVYA